MKLVIFDIDGTLVQPVNGGSYYFFQAFEDVFHQKVETKNLSNYRHITDSYLLDVLFESHICRLPRADEVAAFKHHYIALLEAVHRDSPPAYRMTSGAKVAFERLKKSGDWLVGIATGNWHEAALTKLGFVGIDTWDVLGGYAQRGLRTKASIIEYLMMQAKAQNNGVPFEKIVYIGDSIGDYDACCDLCVAFVGICESASRKQYLELCGATVLSDFGDYERLVEVLEGVTC